MVKYILQGKRPGRNWQQCAIELPNGGGLVVAPVSKEVAEECRSRYIRNPGEDKEVWEFRVVEAGEV